MLALQDLQFNGNRLTRVPTAALAGPESLQNLQLQDNLIGKQSKTLYLFSIQIQRWTNERYKGLTFKLDYLTDPILLFSENLEPLVFKTQPKLLSVNLTNNLIQSIQKGAFLNMTRLVRLILTKNKISSLQNEALSGKWKMSWLRHVWLLFE